MVLLIQKNSEMANTQPGATASIPVIPNAEMATPAWRHSQHPLLITFIIKFITFLLQIVYNSATKC